MNNPEIKILTTNDFNEWSDLLKQIPYNDVYYLPNYVKLFEEHQKEKAKMFCYISENNIILYPFFLKPIKEHFEGSGYFDITSTWYYGGPLSKNADVDSINDFYARFHAYCVDNNIVSEFARMHPLIKNYELVDDDKFITKRWDIVYIDLKKDKAQITAEFNRTCRRFIRIAKTSGIVIERSNSKDSINEFYDLYTDSMNRKEASQFYFFPKEFFIKIVDDFGKNAQIFLAKIGDKVISADLILFNNVFCSNYLRAFDTNYKKANPNNLLISEQIMWSKDIGCKYFLLHGGQAEDDNLFKFKKSFSETISPFYTYQKIHKDEIYYLLAKKYQDMKQSSPSTYFPIYRSPR